MGNATVLVLAKTGIDNGTKLKRHNRNMQVFTVVEIWLRKNDEIFISVLMFSQKGCAALLDYL